MDMDEEDEWIRVEVKELPFGRIGWLTGRGVIHSKLIRLSLCPRVGVLFKGDSLEGIRLSGLASPPMRRGRLFVILYV